MCLYLCGLCRLSFWMLSAYICRLGSHRRDPFSSSEATHVPHNTQAQTTRIRAAMPHACVRACVHSSAHSPAETIRHLDLAQHKSKFAGQYISKNHHSVCSLCSRGLMGGQSAGEQDTISRAAPGNTNLSCAYIWPSWCIVKLGESRGDRKALY